MTGVYSASCMEYLYTLCGKKGKVVPVHATKAYWGSRSTAPLIRDLGTRWKWVVSFTNRPLYRWEVIPVLSSTRLVKPYIWSGCFGDENNLLPMPGFEPWLVQPLAQLLFRLSYPASYTLCGKKWKVCVSSKATGAKIQVTMQFLLLELSALQQESGSPNVAYCRWQCYFVFLKCRVLIPTRG